MRIGRSRHTTRILAGVAGLGVAAGAVIIAHPAGATTTVPAQLALSGVVTGKSLAVSWASTRVTRST